MTNFDQVPDRTGTNSTKWDFCEKIFKERDLLPMWVADSDWPAPQQVIEAIIARSKHGILGYTSPGEEIHQVVLDWVKRRYNWSIRPEWLVFVGGVVAALNVAIKSLSKPGDEILLQSPVYYPFFEAIRDNGCQIVNNQLIYNEKDLRYEMDLAELARVFQNETLYMRQARIKAVLLCNPHNPVGRVWSQEELIDYGETCLKNKSVIIADEIHADLVLKDHSFTPFASISEEFARRSITLMAPSKTFNIAGLNASIAIIPDQGVREQFKRAMGKVINQGNVLGFTALQAAYSNCDDWLAEQLIYLNKNLDFALQYCKKYIPLITAIPIEGTYLLWLDCRKLKLDVKELNEFMVKQARIALDPGNWFGPGGEGFMRINLACPRSTLEEGFKRIREAVEKLRII